MRDRDDGPEPPVTPTERPRSGTAYDVIVPLLVLGGTGAVYRACLSNHLTQDSISYIYSAVSGTGLLHPHHLLYNPLMRAVALLSSGEPIETIVAALQYANIAITLAAVAVVWCIVRVIGAPAWRAALYSIFFGLSAGILSYSSQVEVYTVTVLFLAVAVLGIARGDAAWGPVVCGTGWFAAMLFHQTAVSFGAAIILHELLRPGRRSVQRLGALVGLPLAAIGAVYLSACRLQGCGDIAECCRWITAYAHAGVWGMGTLSRDTVAAGFRGMQEALATTGGRYVFPLILLYVLASVAAWRRPVIENKAIIVACCGWGSVQAVFTMWWFAQNAEFWIASVLPLTVVLAALSHCRPHSPQRRLGRGLSAVVLSAVIAVFALSACEHYRYNRRPNTLMLRVRQCAGAAAPQDTVITADNKLREYCRLYVNSARVVAFNRGIALHALQQKDSASFTQALLEALAGEVRAARQQAGRVLADSRIVHGTVNRIRLLASFDADDFTSGLARRFEARPVRADTSLWFELTIADDAAAAQPSGPAGSD